MKISRYGNNNSELLNSLIENAQKASAVSEDSFEKIASRIINTKKPTSLREVLSQFEGFGDDFGGEEETPLGGEEVPLGGEESPLGDDVDLPTESDTGTSDEVKQKLVDALIAACGSLEDAKACLDAHGGPVDELGGEPVDEFGEEPIGEEMPGEADMGAPEAMEMPQPMEMPAPMEMPY